MVELDVKAQIENALQAYQSGNYQTAARLFGVVACFFESQGNELDSAEMKNNQSVAFLKAGDAQESLNSAQGTAQKFFNSGDYRRQGVAFANEAAALEALKRSDDAAQKYLLAAESLKIAGEDQLRASVMQALAIMQIRKGKLLEALLSMNQGLIDVKQPTIKQKIIRKLLRFRI